MSSQTAFQPQTTIVCSPDQLSGDLDGTVVLLSVENGEYYNMNEGGTRIWPIREKPTTVVALVDQLLEEFEIDRPTCEKETIHFLGQLQKDRLFKVEGAQ